MNKKKFTVRVDTDAFEAAKVYAGQHGTTVTNLVEEFFRSLGKVGEISDEISNETPILNELAGSLSAEASLEDYRIYLEEKYLGGAGKDD